MASRTGKPSPRSVGVEEELLLVDPVTGHPRAVAAAVLRHDGTHGGSSPDPGTGREAGGSGPGGTLEAELKQEQIEVDTTPCESLSDLRTEVVQARRRAADAAGAVGMQVAALATSPMEGASTTTVNARYQRMGDVFGITEHEQLTCGCHVHVSIESPEEGVAVLDRIRGWLPVLLALSANSPFLQGRDTGYASFRSQMVQRWPTAGPTEPFGDATAYRSTVDALVRSGAAMDPAMIYFDGRLSERYSTVEIRISDVCLDAENTILIAALARGLVETAARGWVDHSEPANLRVDLLRASSWRAARLGVRGDLLHPDTLGPAPAATVVDALLRHTEAALSDAGDLEVVRDLARAVLERGNGAVRQRDVLSRSGRLADVVADAVLHTAMRSG
jgi:carboxylate-amine ligase